MRTFWRQRPPRTAEPCPNAELAVQVDPPGESADAEQLGAYAVEVYVVAELNEERQRRVRIDAQGAGLITGSTALSALAFAATTLVTSGGDFQLARLSLWALGVTFLAFMIAALCGLQAGGRIHQNQTVPLAQLEQWRSSDDMWFGSRSEASRIHLCHIINYLERIRRFNDDRAHWLVMGSRTQIVALLGLSVAVGAFLLGEIFPDAEGPWNLLKEP